MIELISKLFGGGVINIGSDTGISNAAITAASRIEIGKNVMLGSGCCVYDTDFHPVKAEYRFGVKRDDRMTVSKPIVIEDGVFIGAHSIILKGTHIGKNSIIGAGSVVTGKIPANQVWAGNPARYIKDIVE